MYPAITSSPVEFPSGRYLSSRAGCFVYQALLDKAATAEATAMAIDAAAAADTGSKGQSRSRVEDVVEGEYGVSA